LESPAFLNEDAMSATDLSQKLVIVTGSGSGLGRAMSIALVRDGATVVGVDLDEAGLAQTAALSKSTGSGRFLAQTCDVRNVDEVERAVARARGENDRLFGLVNCAGLGMAVMNPNYYDDPVNFWKADPERWQLVMDVNVRGPFLFARAVAPSLIEAGRGRIINVTTSFNTMLRGANMPYGQSKAALEAASASWAADLAKSGVTVNVLVPGGAADTKLVPQNSPYDRAQLIRPEVMMAPICWLMSDAADGITGKRFVAQRWDEARPGSENAQKAGAPIAWPDLAREAEGAGQPIPKGGFKV
jgi:3-oxoacyl-[acyl-carrier protein] reductase